jgi:hypothetical protein
VGRSPVESRGQIFPIGIGLADQPPFPQALPGLELFLARNCFLDGVGLDKYQLVEIVGLGMLRTPLLAMRKKPSREVGRYRCVKRTKWPVGQKMDPAAYSAL